VHHDPLGEPADSAETELLEDAAAAFGVDVDGFTVERLANRDGISGLRYGSGEPAVVLLHGGGQNAHTWDVVMAAARLPGIAVDLPGHGSSDWTTDHDHSPRRLAPPVQEALSRWAPRCRVLVGMSLGGMVAAALAEHLPAAEKLVLVDVTPGSVVPRGSTVGAAQQLGAAPLDHLVDQVHRLSPERDPAPLRHSVWHATRATGDGNRTWRSDPSAVVGSFEDLWPEVEALAPRLEVVLAEQGSFVPPADADRLRTLLPPHRVHTVPGATHSVQSTRPVHLAELLRRVVVSSEPE
jgi:esterase